QRPRPGGGHLDAAHRKPALRCAPGDLPGVADRRARPHTNPADMPADAAGRLTPVRRTRIRKDLSAMAIQQSIVREAQSVIGQLLAPGLEDPYPLYAWLR